MIETYPTLSAFDFLRHGFVLRSPSVDVDCERDEAIRRLQGHYRSSLATLQINLNDLVYGDQVHSAAVQVVGSSDRGVCLPETDGVMTDQPGLPIAVMVADCGAVTLVDPVKQAIAVVHSGKVGTEKQIVLAAITKMTESYCSRPEDLVIQIAPCIRPPSYEIDFARQIREDCAAAGIASANIHDCGINTAADTERYYSYRVEEGKTGRHLMVAMLNASEPSEGVRE